MEGITLIEQAQAFFEQVDLVQLAKDTGCRVQERHPKFHDVWAWAGPDPEQAADIKRMILSHLKCCLDILHSHDHEKEQP